MSISDMDKFLKALDGVKQEYICGVCLEICRDPVRLTECFHLVCNEHFKDLKVCPICKTSLKNCSTYKDEHITKAVETARLLDIIFSTNKSDDWIPSITEKVESKLDDDVKKDEINMINRKQNINISNISNMTVLKLSKACEKRNKKGETLLHIACRLGKADKVEACLKAGANTNTKDNAGWTPLHEVVQNGRLDLVKLLLQYNTLIDVPGPGNETPLHEAVRYAHEQIAEELVMNGANIHASNCKGETPMHLAKESLQAILSHAADNIVQTQGVNISYVSTLHSELDLDDIRVYCTSQFHTVQSKLKTLSKHHNNLHIEAKFTKKITHLIVDADDDGVCATACEVLLGIVNNIWVLRAQWVTKSNEDKLEPFEDYEVKGVGMSSNEGPKNSRYNKYKQLPGLFNGCHFYFHNFNVQYEITKNFSVTKAILSKLVVDAGGVVLRRVPNPESIPEYETLIPYHAKPDGKLHKCSHYIIFKDMFEPMYNMQHLKALPIGWFIECIEKYQLCETW